MILHRIDIWIWAKPKKIRRLSHSTNRLEIFQVHLRQKKKHSNNVLIWLRHVSYNICNACWVYWDSLECIRNLYSRENWYLQRTHEPSDWRHTRGTESGSVLPFRFSFSRPNVRVCSYYFCVEHLDQNLSPVTVSMLHRFRLWMIKYFRNSSLI